MIEKRGNRTWYRSVKSFYKLGKKGSVIHVVASMAACLTITFSTPALAGSAPITTTISNARTTSQSLSSKYNSIIVTEDGSITVENENAIDASNGMDGSGITNKGSISVTNTSDSSEIAGIYAMDVRNNSSITNSGDIEITDSASDSTTVGIKVENSTDSSVENSGTISLTADSADGMYGIFNAEDTMDINSKPIPASHGDAAVTNSVTNSGTISVVADSAHYIAGIRNDKDGTVTNSGTISVSANQTAITIKSTTYDTHIAGIYSKGNVTNSGTIKATTGTGELNDHFYSVWTTGSLTNEETGTLKGRLKAGATTNSGLIQLSLGNSKIDGDFRQDEDGTLGITLYNDASGKADFSKLSVSGTTTLEDNSGVYVDVTTIDANQTILIGDTLTGVIDSTGGIAADTDTLSLNDNSVLLDFTASLSDNNTSLDLTVEKGMSVLDATKEGGQTGVQGAAAVLDGMSGTANPEITTFISYLNQQNNPGRVANQVAGAAPVNTTQAPAVSGQLVNTMSAVLQARQNSARGLNSGDPVFSDKNFWVKPFAVTMEQDDVDGVNGFSADAYGLGIGMDGELTSKDRLGLAFFYTGADTETNNIDQESDTDVFNLMAYGSRPITNGDTTLFWQAGGGIQDMASSRYIQALNQTAKADYTAKHLFALTRASRVFQVSQDVTLSAGAAVSYTWFYTPSYTESNAGGMNLSVDSSDTQALVTALEGGISWSGAKDVQITAKASIGYDLIDDDTAVSSRFQGGGVSFATQGIDNSPVVYTASLGIGRKLSNNLSLDANYDLEGRGDDFLSHMLSLKLNWTF